MTQTIEQKIQLRLNVIEGCLCENVHIQNPEGVQRILNNVTKWWDRLSEQDKLYVQSAQHIIDNSIPYDNS